MCALTLQEGVQLAHALAAQVAADAKVRAVIIKGPANDLWNLRTSGTTSIDVDVLVEPHRLAHVRQLLVSIGWTASEVLGPSVLAPHSITFRHSAWPCELDVHDRFPGFLAEPAEVFEVIWKSSVESRIASAPARMAGFEASIAIAALHLLRDASLNAVRFHKLASSLAASTSLDQRRQLYEFASKVGCEVTLAPLLSYLGRHNVSRQPMNAQLLAWRVRASSGRAQSVASVHVLFQSSLRNWPRLIFRLAWPTREVMLAKNRGHAAGRGGLVGARLKRFSRGLLALPAAVRTWRDAARRTTPVLVISHVGQENSTDRRIDPCPDSTSQSSSQPTTR